MEMFDPVHPGAGIRAWMGDKITVSALAKHLRMTRANLSMILNGRLGVSASVAIKLAEAFPKTDARFWLGLQSQCDLAHARRRARKKIKPLILLVKKPTSVAKTGSSAKPGSKATKKASSVNYRKAA